MLVRKNEVAACFHSPYIEYGYRKVRNFREAFCSLFVLHNESMNIWSHFIGFICIVLAGVNLSYDVIIVSSSSRFFEIIAVEGYLIGAIFCLLFSAAFHWFGCLSELHYDFLLKVDLTGVALLITGSYLPGIYYGFYCFPGLQNFYMYYVMGIFFTGLIAPWVEHRIRGYSVKQFMLASLVLAGLIPAIHWMSVTPAAYRSVTGRYVVLLFLWYGLGFGLQQSCIPERFYPKSFWCAYIFPSHALWHFCVLNAVYVWFHLIVRYRSLVLDNFCSISS